MNKKTAKNIMIFFLVFLPLQYAIVGAVGVWKSEPWPAFVMPAFKSVFGTGDTITVSELKFYLEDEKNDELTEIQAEIIFDGIVQSQLQGFFRTHFSDFETAARYGPETKTWLKKRIDKAYPSFNANRLHLRWLKKSFFVSTSTPTTTSAADSTHEATEIAKEFTIPLYGE
jgi:hypothetical protein